MKVAIFRSIDSGYESVNPESFEPVGGYIRASEYIEVDFVPLEHGRIAAEEVAVLEAKKDKVQAEAVAVVAEIERRICALFPSPPPDPETEIVAPEQITTKVSKPGGWKTRE